jgi:nucleoside-triphosphatase
VGLHIFLQGPRNVGKSTVIRKTLDLLTEQGPLKLGGFFTWRDVDDQHIYMRSVQVGLEQEVYRLATYDIKAGTLCCNPQTFEQAGEHLLAESVGADLMLMDELGFLEEQATAFRQAVLTQISGNTPILGVLRQGDIPWHREIKASPRVMLYEASEKNRDSLPQELAAQLAVLLMHR